MRRAAALAASLILAPRFAAAAPPPGDWPCPGCVVHVPEPLPDGPRPLLVALHGDGGAVRPLVRAFQGATDAAGVILLAPRCPRSMGCTAGSFWQWLQTGGHDEGWLGGLIDAVSARYAIDRARVYAAGYSGGATYLGAYVPSHPTRFAAVAHVAGGAPYGRSCPSCKVSVLFVIGGLDPMIVPYTAPLRAYYDACGGHEVVWQQLPGVTHEGILGVLQAGRARDVLSWLLARPSACQAASARDAGAEEAGAPPAGSGSPSAPAPTAPPVSPPPTPVAPVSPPVPPVRPRGGCACAAAPAAGVRWPDLSLLVALGALVTRRRVRRGTREDGAIRRAPR